MDSLSAVFVDTSSAYGIWVFGGNNRLVALNSDIRVGQWDRGYVAKLLLSVYPARGEHFNN